MRTILLLMVFLIVALCGYAQEEQAEKIAVPEESTPVDIETQETIVDVEVPESAEVDEEPLESEDSYQLPWVGEVSANRVNLRSGGNSNYEILAQASKGDIIIVIDENLGWYRIEPTPGVSFWIHKNFVDEGIVTAYSVNIRSGPGTQYSINSQAEKGEHVTVLEEDEDWYRLEPTPRSSVWIYSDYVVYKMPYDEYQDKVDKEIAEQIALKERKRLFEEATEFEHKEFYKPLDEIDFEGIIENYKVIAGKYPGTDEGQKSLEQLELVRNKYADSLEFLQQAKKQKKVKKIVAESSLQQVSSLDKMKRGDRVIVEGTLEDFGVVIHRPGTYKLVNGRMRICILKADEVDLNPFLYYKVRITGKMLESDFDIPAIQVEEIQVLKE